MKQSLLANKTLREEPRDEQSPGAILLIRAGFVEKLSAGLYNFLPLGLRVFRKIEKIVREEMEKIDGQEILMSALTPRENWQKTGRWETFDALFKLKSFDEKEYALAATHEEIIAPLAKKLILSYKDLPLYLFQIQTKFRNEKRAKSGLLRLREFSMKDLYSFHATEKDLNEYYERMIKSYFSIFERTGLREKTFLTFASGGSFSEYSHEFQTLCESGEDIIHICKKCQIAVNEEIKAKTPKCPACGENDFETKKAVETGNIFKLGDKYSAPFDLKFRDAEGQEQNVIMGCYGLGLPRLLGAVAEIWQDEKGLIWPKEIAPFQIHLLNLAKDKKQANELYEKLSNEKIEVLYDDRELSAGEKFAEADLIGIPLRLVISEKTLKEDSVELKKRNEEKTELVKISEILTVI